MDLIGDRSNEKIIFRAFVRRTLEKRSKLISEAQDKNMPNFTDKSHARRSFEVSDETLVYNHKRLLRFLDMRRLTFPKSTTKYKRKRIFAVHNTIIMKQYDSTMRELTYGLSDSIVAEIKSGMQNKSS